MLCQIHLNQCLMSIYMQKLYTVEEASTAKLVTLTANLMQLEGVEQVKVAADDGRDVRASHGLSPHPDRGDGAGLGPEQRRSDDYARHH